ncbi:methylated-DNA--[protein]-cysteine S-methyltransferase [Corallococcus sp. bb12-1]|uniref:methylated-DNA--[protein]-cysteine S-methyltransferase n=1 Tax=Corallococcus sp. bb12-1 TaxID=2996784 RepID=UPI00226F25A0|nr:methylated-DNA--[protein]-cysteine S-methyltransferase [Corallococcus sp. bb12-1]MCY1042207.1 methylated-DNA--[protein]-cysteine S-methyltransferase [Corallococcus sp. bb12-1]
MKPRQRFFIDSTPTPTGPMLIVCDEAGQLRALDWEGYEARMHRLLRLHYGEDGCVLEPMKDPSGRTSALQAYLRGDISAINALPVATAGTAFQREVWRALRDIPAGTTTTYARLAERIGRPRAVRAVGAANGANPVGIVVPCHRVVGANASLTGYAGGIERKRWLLDHEQTHAPRA